MSFKPMIMWLCYFVQWFKCCFWINNEDQVMFSPNQNHQKNHQHAWLSMGSSAQTPVLSAQTLGRGSDWFNLFFVLFILFPVSTLCLICTSVIFLLFIASCSLCSCHIIITHVVHITHAYTVVHRCVYYHCVASHPSFPVFVYGWIALISCNPTKVK